MRLKKPCTNCGGKPPKGSIFCNNCGQRLQREIASVSGLDADESRPPEWFRRVSKPKRLTKEEETRQGIKRIETAISGKQPRKWVAEMMPGQRVRLAYADGRIHHRSRRLWERDEASLVRNPWTAEQEGALLLIVGEKPHRFIDLKTSWISTDHRTQVYLGIEDTRHSDNSGHYGAVVEVTSGTSKE